MSMSRRSICVDRTNPSLCDLEIIAGTGNVEDDNVQRAPPILATKVFLYGISDKWKELIQSAVKTLPSSVPEDAVNVNVNVKDKVFIPQISRDILDNIISFVYAGHTVEPQGIPLDDDNLGQYLQAARFLEMGDIERECLNYLDSKVITLDNFPVLFKWSSDFGKPEIQPKMSKFLKEHSAQIPELIRRCKNDWNISESEVARMIRDWLSSSGGEIASCDVNMEHVIRQFSDKDEKIQLLDAFFDVGDPSEWSTTAFRLLKNLCKSGDQHLDPGPDTNLPCGSNSAQVQRPAQNPADKQSLQTKNVSSSSAEPPIKIRRTGNNARTSSSNVGVVQLEGEGLLEEPTQDESEWEKDENSDDSSSTSASCSSSPVHSSSSSCSSLYGPSTQLCQGKIYFLLKNQTYPGGLFLWSYNLKTNKSLRQAKLPPSVQDRRKFAMVYFSNTIYFIGGESSATGGVIKKIDTFNIETREWQKREKLRMLKPRFDLQAFATHNVIYVVGGCKKKQREGRSVGVATNTVQEILFETGNAPCRARTLELNSMENCRANAGILSLNHKVYAIGGYVWDQEAGGAMSASNLCERFDPNRHLCQGQWDEIASMKYRRLGLAAVATPRPYGQRIYALGGSLQSPSAETTDTPDNLQSLDTVEIYDPKKDSWTTGPPMKKKRAFFSAVYFNKRIYALGGDSEAQPTIEEFNLKTKEWTLKGDLKAGGNFAAIALKDEFE